MIKCACNNQECKGICCKVNLFRERKSLDCCPAADGEGLRNGRKDKWLKIAEKNAQHINQVFFEGDPNYNGGKPVNQAPGHEGLELALVKLYRVTGNQLYLQMAKNFLDIRGVTYKTDGVVKTVIFD